MVNSLHWPNRCLGFFFYLKYDIVHDKSSMRLEGACAENVMGKINAPFWL